MYDTCTSRRTHRLKEKVPDYIFFSRPPTTSPHAAPAAIERPEGSLRPPPAFFPEKKYVGPSLGRLTAPRPRAPVGADSACPNVDFGPRSRRAGAKLPCVRPGHGHATTFQASLKQN